MIDDEIQLEILDRNPLEDEIGVIQPEKKERNAIKALLFIVGWFCTSIVLTMYNKFLFGSSYTPASPDEEVTIFRPFLTTSLHTAIQLFLCSIILVGFVDWTKCCFTYIILKIKKALPQNYEELESELNRWPLLKDKIRSIQLPSLSIYLKYALPCGLATALDIGLSNMALEFIPVSLHTMLKSTAPIFVLLVALCLKLEKPQLKQFFIIASMCLGVGLMLNNTSNSHARNDSTTEYSGLDRFIGATMVLVASSMAGFRVGLAQVLLQQDCTEPSNSQPRQIYTLFLISPVMTIALLILSFINENLFSNHQDPVEVHGTHKFIVFPLQFLLMSTGGVIAFFMIYAEFGLIKVTSAVFLSVSGIIKEIILISMGVILFHEQLTWLNILGLLISIVAIAYYNYDKFMNTKIDE